MMTFSFLFLISIKNGCNQLYIFAVLARAVLRAGSSPHVRAGWSRLDHAERKHERIQRWRCRPRAGALGFDVGQAARTILRCVLRREFVTLMQCMYTLRSSCMLQESWHHWRPLL